ncbi:hypothetical protein KAW38_04160 [Candidatus Micrarchaeota archaeon]|nr:hypothetical protein [Candidatus Micrarchaeota archaeon]
MEGKNIQKETKGNSVNHVIETIPKNGLIRRLLERIKSKNQQNFPTSLAEGIKQEIKVGVNYQDLLKIKFAETLLVKFKIMGKEGILVCKYGSNNSNIMRSGKEELEVNFGSVDLAKIFEADLDFNRNKLIIYFKGVEDFPLKLIVKKIQIIQ